MSHERFCVLHGLSVPGIGLVSIETRSIKGQMANPHARADLWGRDENVDVSLCSRFQHLKKKIT